MAQRAPSKRRSSRGGDEDAQPDRHVVRRVEPAESKLVPVIHVDADNTDGTLIMVGQWMPTQRRTIAYDDGQPTADDVQPRRNVVQRTAAWILAMESFSRLLDKVEHKRDLRAITEGLFSGVPMPAHMQALKQSASVEQMRTRIVHMVAWANDITHLHSSVRPPLETAFAQREQQVLSLSLSLSMVCELTRVLC